MVLFAGEVPNQMSTEIETLDSDWVVIKTND